MSTPVQIIVLSILGILQGAATPYVRSGSVSAIAIVSIASAIMVGAWIYTVRQVTTPVSLSAMLWDGIFGVAYYSALIIFDSQRPSASALIGVVFVLIGLVLIHL